MVRVTAKGEPMRRTRRRWGENDYLFIALNCHLSVRFKVSRLSDSLEKSYHEDSIGDRALGLFRPSQ